MPGRIHPHQIHCFGITTVTTTTCQQAWQTMTTLSHNQEVRNFTQTLAMDDYLVETELFPRLVLEAYTTWNLELPMGPQQMLLFNEQRGGGQGDYRQGMRKKIANVVDCLSRFPQSKRAVLTICNTAFAEHGNDEQAKCLREIHFYIDKNTLHASCFFRAQAASIFPKNIHFLGSLMHEIANSLPPPIDVGTLFYCTTLLVSDRT